MSVEITHFRLMFNGTRRVIKEKIDVDTIEGIEAVRGELKKKYQCEQVDLFYKHK